MLLSKAMIAEYFLAGLWTEQDIDNAVNKGKLSAEDAAEIKAIEGTEGLKALKGNL